LHVDETSIFVDEAAITALRVSPIEAAGNRA
jgi:hypothetical protein